MLDRRGAGQHGHCRNGRHKNDKGYSNNPGDKPTLPATLLRFLKKKLSLIDLGLFRR